MTKRTLITALAAAAVCSTVVVAPAMLSPAAAQAYIGVQIGTPPPPPRYEVVPAPRAGYVWAPGYWHWEHERHVWMPGHWMEARRGYHWVPDRWDNHEQAWRHERGHWDRDG